MKTFNYFICSLLVVALVACKSDKKDAHLPPLPPDKSKVRTTINVYTDEEGKVVLSKNGNATVGPDSYVQWNVIDPQLTITAIRPEIRQNQTNIWNDKPEAINRNVWRGLVFGQTGSEYYYVDWERNDGGTKTTGTIDPVISVDPEPGS